MNWFWKIFGLRLHYFVIDERKNERGEERFWSYKRRFWHFYRHIVVENGGTTTVEERSVWQFRLETPFRRSPKDSWFSIRFHIGNAGSETPWDGHLTLFGMSWYWGHTGFRKLAERPTKCSEYKWDSREWSLRIIDNDLHWELGSHSDLCDKYPRYKPAGVIRKGLFGITSPSGKRRRTLWPSGSVLLSIPEMIWGPYRYSYEKIDTHQTLLSFPEDDYAVILTLEKVLYGRTKTNKAKHIQSWSVDVDAPRGIPSHVDHSGGYKGDRTFGYGVKLENVPEDLTGWEVIATVAAKMWVENERERTGFVKPDPLDY